MTTVSKPTKLKEYTVAELAGLTSYSVAYIHQFIKSKAIRARVENNRYVISESEAQKLIQRKRDTVGCRYFKKNQIHQSSP